MSEFWTTWKTFPYSARGEHLDAPIGPGLYELRCVRTGKALAFGHSANVALMLSITRAVSLWRRLMRRWHGESRDERDIEYRTMAVTSTRHAEDRAKTLMRRRQAWWSRAVSN